MRFKPVPVSSELHRLGGEGAVFRADFRNIEDELTARYAGKARVVYIDPPFNTGGAFEYRQGKKQLAYRDDMPREEYFSMMRRAAELSKRLLAEDGTFFLHVDFRVSARLRMICDEVFGENAFTNEIIWVYKSGGRTRRSFSRKHDTILMYRMSPESYFNIEAVGKPRGAKRRNHMKKCLDDMGRVYFSIRSNGREYRYYEDVLDGFGADRAPVGVRRLHQLVVEALNHRTCQFVQLDRTHVWDDIEHLHQRDPERTGYLTQKPEALLKRVILSCSREGDVVIDLFGGSGTTAVTAAKLGRSFVTVDKEDLAVAVTRRRLLERCLKLRLYDAARPMTVELSEPSSDKLPDFERYFDVSEDKGRALLKVKRAPKDARLRSVISGFVENGVFNATEYDLEPSFGDEFRVDGGKAVHVVDEDFNEYYFTLE